jgi:hypothetical protein
MHVCVSGDAPSARSSPRLSGEKSNSDDISISGSRIGCGLDVWDWQGTKTNFLDDAGRLTPPFHEGIFGYSTSDRTLWQVKLEPFQEQLLACDVGSGVEAIHIGDGRLLPQHPDRERKVHSHDQSPAAQVAGLSGLGS